MKVYYVTQVLKQGINIKRCVLTTYSNLLNTKSHLLLARRMGQDRNCNRKSCLLNYWSFL